MVLAASLRNDARRGRMKGRPGRSTLRSGRCPFTGYKLVVGNRDFCIIDSVQDEGVVCVIWVIAKRSNDAVYQLATARLTYITGPAIQAVLRDLLETRRPTGRTKPPALRRGGRGRVRL